jgi:hypothetical protein
LPTPEELAIAPELAILAAIEAALDLAIVALVAAQPELGPTDDGHDAVTSPAAHSADAVITTAQALAAAIACYRVTLRRRDRDELPF